MHLSLTQHCQILVIHWYKRGTRQNPVKFSSDTEFLLGDPGCPTEEKAGMKKHTKEQVHSSAQTKASFHSSALRFCGFPTTWKSYRNILLGEEYCLRYSVSIKSS